MAERFEVAWRLVVDHGDADDLAAALAPETDDHARLSAEDDELLVAGEGSTGESLHTLDDVLACLTAAVGAMETSED